MNKKVISADNTIETTKKGNIMKKLIAATGMILITCVCVQSIYTRPAFAVANPAAAERNEQSEKGYIVRDYKGKIAVFRTGESLPLKVTRTRTVSLPRQDAKKLKEGIAVETSRDMEKVLEDYCS